MEKMDNLVKDLTTKKLYQYREPFHNETEAFTEEDYKIVNRLFITFQTIFPAFRHAWGTEAEFENAKREWMKCFKEFGLTDLEAIKRGVNKFRGASSPFVPTPGQFLKMCEKEISLIPDFYIAIESQPASKEVQSREMAKIRELLK